MRWTRSLVFWPRSCNYIILAGGIGSRAHWSWPDRMSHARPHVRRARLRRGSSCWPAVGRRQDRRARRRSTQLLPSRDLAEFLVRASAWFSAQAAVASLQLAPIESVACVAERVIDKRLRSLTSRAARVPRQAGGSSSRSRNGTAPQCLEDQALE